MSKMAPFSFPSFKTNLIFTLLTYSFLFNPTCPTKSVSKFSSLVAVWLD